MQLVLFHIQHPITQELLFLHEDGTVLIYSQLKKQVGLKSSSSLCCVAVGSVLCIRDSFSRLPFHNFRIGTSKMSL
jgi:hypothetical protein